MQMTNEQYVAEMKAAMLADCDVFKAELQKLLAQVETAVDQTILGPGMKVFAKQGAQVMMASGVALANHALANGDVEGAFRALNRTIGQLTKVRADYRRLQAQ